MQLEKAQKLRKMWGNNHCDHPDFDKEYFNSTDTGDYVCVVCGRAFSKEMKEKIEDENIMTKNNSDN
jgi:hypothetical protein